MSTFIEVNISKCISCISATAFIISECVFQVLLTYWEYLELKVIYEGGVANMKHFLLFRCLLCILIGAVTNWALYEYCLLWKCISISSSTAICERDLNETYLFQISILFFRKGAVGKKNYLNVYQIVKYISLCSVYF